MLSAGGWGREWNVAPLTFSLSASQWMAAMTLIVSRGWVQKSRQMLRSENGTRVRAIPARSRRPVASCWSMETEIRRPGGVTVNS